MSNGRQRIFVSGPYSSDPAANTERAIAAGMALLDAGFLPFIPHLSHYMDALFPRPYEAWMELDFGWLRVCHAVLRLPGLSPGADRECELARELGLPVVEVRVSLPLAVEELEAWFKTDIGP